MDKGLGTKTQIDEQMAREKVVSYSEVLPFLVIGSWFPGIAVIYLAWNSGDRVAMLSWLAAFSMHVTYRIYRYFAFKKAGEKLNYRREYIEQIISGAINGSLWGWSLVIFGDVEPDVRHMVYFLICSFCGLGAMVAGFSRWAYGSYVSCALIPLEIQLLVVGGTYNYTIALLIVVAAAVVFVIARQHYFSTNNLLLLKIENQLFADELKEKNRLLKQANEGKSRLISAASHDLRQPVYGLRLMFNKMVERCRQHNRNRNQALLCPVMRTETEVEEIELALQYLSQSLNNLLDLSRLEAGAISAEKHPVDVDELLSRLNYIFSPQAIAKNVELRVRHTSLTVEADYSLLHSILANLVANAISYTDSGGVLLAARRYGNICRILIMDQGIGIKIDDIESRRLFDEFFRLSAEKKGSSTAGLGLAIAERFAQSMGTRIDVSSIEHKGSCFSIDLPICKPLHEPAAAIMLPGGAAIQGFGGVKAMLVTTAQQESGWILGLLNENDAITSCCSTMAEAFEWARKIVVGILIVDLPGIRTTTPNGDWQVIKQIANFSNTLQIIVLITPEPESQLSPHPFGIANCRLVDRSTTPLKLKSILMREMRQKAIRITSAGANHRRAFPYE